MDRLKVLIVDDSAVYRKILSEAVGSIGTAEVKNTASNGVLALERMQSNIYDVVLLDVNMPEMDGLETLKNIKRRWSNVPVIMISGNGGKNAEITLKALEMGALDFILKPLEENYEKNMEFISSQLKVLFAQIRIKSNSIKSYSTISHINNSVTNIEIAESTKNVQKTYISGADLILVASSTGGPVALETVFSGFGKNFVKPILIVQHMPPDFTKVLAESLTRKSEMRFCEGAEGDIVRAGQGIIAAGGFHMLVKKDSGSTTKIYTSKSEFVNGVRPSADVLFKSVAEEYKGLRILAVILTGMGSDGTEGVRELKKKCNCYCITQSEQTCVVYGMPRSVKEAGLSDESLDLNHITQRIIKITNYGS